MKASLLVLVLLALTCCNKRLQRTVEQVDYIPAYETPSYARFPDITFVEIPGTDSVLVLRIKSERVREARKYVDKSHTTINVNSGNNSNNDIKDKSKVKPVDKSKVKNSQNEAPLKTTEKTVEREASSGFQVSLPLAISAFALLLAGAYLLIRKKFF